MLGTLRLILAYCVLVAHLSPQDWQMTHLGRFAVFGFYILSGFLITRVLHEQYRFDFGPFWANRILRLFPLYYMVLGITLLCIMLLPPSFAMLRSEFWNVPNASALDWVNAFLVIPQGFYLEDELRFAPVPVMWSVAVELVCYLMLWTFVARSVFKAFAVFLAAGFYHLTVVGMTGSGAWVLIYYPFWAALLPFAAGALIHFANRRITLTGLTFPATALSLGGAVWLTLLGLSCLVKPWSADAVLGLFYASTAALAVLVFMLTATRVRLPGRLDKALGDLAYPVFLGHLLVNSLMIWTIGLGGRTAVNLAVTLIVTTLAAYVLVRLQDRLIEPVRERVRNWQILPVPQTKEYRI